MADQPSDESAQDPPAGPASGPPLADETHKLLVAVQEWAQRAMPEPPSGHGGPECQWCPLCQFASILRGERPELSDRVAEVGAALAAAFRALIDSATNAGPGPSPDAVNRPPAPRPDPPPARPRPAPRVQRVQFDDPDDTGGTSR